LTSSPWSETIKPVIGRTCGGREYQEGVSNGQPTPVGHNRQRRSTRRRWWLIVIVALLIAWIVFQISISWLDGG
jgi:hypothetical protein